MVGENGRKFGSPSDSIRFVGNLVHAERYKGKHPVRCLISLLFGVVVYSPFAAIGANPARPLGLTVHNGQLQHNGKPYRGIGANYFSLFGRTLHDPSDKSYRDRLARLSQADIPFVRFMACGFWPIDWDLYRRDKDAYFGRLDDVVKSAEESGIGLIPSLFWHVSTIPDLVGEPMDQFGNPESKTAAFIRQYTEEVVLRYKDSPAVWGWEFGNEFSLAVDLPNASQHRPPVWPTLKTATKRTHRDELSSRMMLAAFAEFAKTVRKHDPHRILITGNSVPRPSAFHNSKERSWKTDSREQFETILLRDNPDPFDTLCVHLYPSKEGKGYPGGATSMDELVRIVQSTASKAGNPLFIGEFGASRELGKTEERAKFLNMVAAIERQGVALSAFWVFDYRRQEKDYNVTFDNSRRYMLEIVGEANRRMEKGVGGKLQQGQ